MQINTLHAGVFLRWLMRVADIFSLISREFSHSVKAQKIKSYFIVFQLNKTILHWNICYMIIVEKKQNF